MYRKYLTPDQVAVMFGASSCDYQALIDWTQAHGLSATPFSDRFLLGVTGTADRVGAALHVTFGTYARPDGSSFYAPDRDPTLDFSPKLLGISGLDDCFLPRTGLTSSPINEGGAAGDTVN